MRLVQTNGADISLFQFDYDLTWSVFFMNADKTIYGRYGTRSQKDAMHDVSMESFKKALEAALEIHKGYPANKQSLAGKSAVETKYKTPESFPSLSKYQPTLASGPNTAKSCIHCHMINDALRLSYHAAGQAIPDEMLWLTPMPDWLGLSFDPAQRATVKSVTPLSAAEKAGFKAGDELLSLEGQPLVSLADVQWVLRNSKEPGVVKAMVKRGDARQEISLGLESGWKRKGEFTWRTSTWDLRRMAAGGMICKDLSAEERKKADLGENVLALQVTYLGQFGQHAAAQKAGLRKDDIIIEADGQNTRMNESDFLAFGVQKKKIGEMLRLTVLRGTQRKSFELPIQ